MIELSCQKVCVTYPHASEPTLNGISFRIPPGERTALLGLNGTGKTTLLKTIVGLLPHVGEIRVGETIVSPETHSNIRRKVGYLFNVPEEQLLFPRVLDDVAFGLKSLGMKKAEAERQALETLTLLEAQDLADRLVYDLSHGQKQRVALAGVMVMRPELLLLDEPTAGLDPPGKNRLAELLASLDASMLIATHDIAFARKVCRQPLLLDVSGEAATETDYETLMKKWELK